MTGDSGAVIAKALAACRHLPGIEQSTSYGSPALKVHGKVICAAKDPKTLYLRCPLEEKDMLMEAAPEIYYETGHYKGWPGLLVRISKITKAELSVRLERAWRIQAPKKLIKEFDGAGTPASKRTSTKSKRTS